MTELKTEQIDGDVVFTVKVVPGAGSTTIAGLYGEMLKVRIAAAPEKGKANKALCRFLARQLHLKNNDISILSGQTSPVKRLRIHGLSACDLIKKLSLDREGER